VTKASEPKTLMLLEEYFSRMLARGEFLGFIAKFEKQVVQYSAI
jgi:hypothetical protein